MKGDLTINGLDAYEEYGVGLEDGALSALMTPPPMKQYVEGASRAEHGRRVVVKDPRADSRDAFLARYAKFCGEVLARGAFTLSTRHQPGVTYRLVYKSCSQFGQYSGRAALFSLRVCEPDPSNRVEE